MAVAQQSKGYANMTRLGRSRTQRSSQRSGSGVGVDKSNARASASKSNNTNLSLAEQLWHLDTRLKDEKDVKLNELYTEYQSILLFDSDSKNALLKFEEQQARMQHDYDEQCQEIVQSLQVNENNAMTKYQETVKRYEAARDAEIARQTAVIESNFRKKMDEYNRNCKDVLDETISAIATGNQIMHNFGIDPSRYNVCVDENEASSTSTAELLNRIKTSAMRINAAETSGSGIQNRNIRNVMDSNGSNLQSNISNDKLRKGIGAFKVTTQVSKEACRGIMQIGKRIKAEREINQQVRESSVEIVKALKLLTIRKSIAKVICSRELPDESIKDEEIKKIVEIENQKFELNKQKAHEQMEKECNQVTPSKIAEEVKKKKAAHALNLEILVGKRQESMNTYKRNIDERVKNYLEKLHDYITDQNALKKPFDYEASNATDISPENILFRKRADYKEIIDLFSEQKLLNSLELKLFLPEDKDMRDWYNKIKYDVNMYQKKQSIQYDIDKIRTKVLKEYNELHGLDVSPEDFSDEELLNFVRAQYDKCIEEETRLYDVTTSNKFLGEKVLNEGYSDIPNIIALATNKSYVDKGDSKIYESYTSKFDNQTLMFVYRDENEANLLANMIKFFIYEVLISYHTESMVVNVVNPTGDIRFKDLQVSRDYISTNADTMGKVVKGPNYVNLYDTQDEVSTLSKDILRQESKLTKGDLVGKTFNTIVHEKRASGGIVPKYTINVIVNQPINNNPLSRYNGTGESKGILNVYFTDIDTLIKPSYDQQTGVINRTISYETVKLARTVKCIVEVKSKTKGKSYIMDVSYQNLSTHCTFTYTPKDLMSLERMRKYLVERSIKSLKNKLFVTTTEFIDDIITDKGLKKRRKEQEEINSDRDMFEKSGKYQPFTKKYSECFDFVTRNKDTVNILQQNVISDRDNYERQMASLDSLISNSDTEGLSNAFKALEAYQTNLSTVEKYEECEGFVQMMDDKSSTTSQSLQRLVNSDLDRRQADLDRRNELNPKCYWEGDCTKTLPLYLGYVENDKTKAQPVILDETSKPHFFIAGTTGGGKSVTLGVLVNTLKMMFSPEDIEVVYFDFKVAEVAMHASPYKMPQCSAMCGSAASEYLISLLNYVNSEMDRRYEMNKNTNTNKLSSLIKYQKNKKKELSTVLGYYKKIREDAEGMSLSGNVLDYIDKLIEQKKKDVDDIYVPARMLLLVDEAAQAFQTEDDNLKSEVRRIFIRLAQLARAAGIHMLLVSQDADKMPDALMNLLKTRGCTVAPKAISRNVIKNDFCARPENQFVGFFGINDMDGAEEGNVQYVVPFNREEDTLRLSKIADSLCTKLGCKSRDAVIYDDNKIYTNEEHNEQLEIYRNELDGNTVLLGEGVYYQKIFKPHKIRFELQERSSATIISPLESERTRILNVMINCLKDYAYVAPVYCKSIPDDFPVEFFYNLPFNKKNDFRYFSAGSGIIAQTEAIDLARESEFDQFLADDIFGELDASEVEVRQVPTLEIHLDEPQSNEDYETARVCTNKQLELVKAGEKTYEEVVEDVHLSLLCTLKDNCLWRFTEVGAVSKDELEVLNKECTFIENILFMIDSRKENKKKNKNIKLVPIYYVIFDMTKHKFVQENAYSFWKEFRSIIDEASLYNIHIIFSDSSFSYIDREIGRYYMISNADSIPGIPRKMKGVDKNLMKLVDNMGKCNALVKLPKDNPDAERLKAEQTILKTTLENIKKEMTENEIESHMIKAG